MNLTVNFDGGARPTNPGHGAYGVAITDEAGTVIIADKKYLGSNVTNNEAEWLGMLRGLHLALEVPGVTHIELVGDSNLVIRQLNGEYNITSKRLFAFKKQYDTMVAEHPGIPVSSHWVPREENVVADGLCGSILKEIAKPGDKVGSKKLDGRKLVFDEAAAFFGDRVKPRFPWLRNPAFSVHGLSFYSKITADLSLPSVEKKIWEEILEENRVRPVLLAYRPFGNRPTPIAMRYHEDPTAGYRQALNADDGGMELMFAFADSLVAEDAPKITRKNFDTQEQEEIALYGYRGSIILVLKGIWIPARHLRGILTYDTGREHDPLGEGTDGYRIGG